MKAQIIQRSGGATRLDPLFRFLFDHPFITRLLFATSSISFTIWLLARRTDPSPGPFAPLDRLVVALWVVPHLLYVFGVWSKKVTFTIGPILLVTSLILISTVLNSDGIAGLLWLHSVLFLILFGGLLADTVIRLRTNGEDFDK